MIRASMVASLALGATHAVGPSPWLEFAVDTVAALGAAGAAVVAVVLANREGRERRRLRAENDALRLREARRQALRVTATGSGEELEAPTGLGPKPTGIFVWSVTIENRGDTPIRNVVTQVRGARAKPDMIRDHAEHIAVIPADSSATTNTAMRRRVSTDIGEPVITLWFLDSDDRWWERSNEGSVREVEGPPCDPASLQWTSGG